MTEESAEEEEEEEEDDAKKKKKKKKKSKSKKKKKGSKSKKKKGSKSKKKKGSKSKKKGSKSKKKKGSKSKKKGSKSKKGKSKKESKSKKDKSKKSKKGEASPTPAKPAPSTPGRGARVQVRRTTTASPAGSSTALAVGVGAPGAWGPYGPPGPFGSPSPYGGSLTSIGGMPMHKTYRLRPGHSTISIPSGDGGGVVLDVKYRGKRQPHMTVSGSGSYTSSQLALPPTSAMYDDMRFMPGAMFPGDTSDSYMSSLSFDDSYLAEAYSSFTVDAPYSQGEGAFGAGFTFPPQMHMQAPVDVAATAMMSPTIQVHMQPPLAEPVPQAFGMAGDAEQLQMQVQCFGPLNQPLDLSRAVVQQRPDQTAPLTIHPQIPVEQPIQVQPGYYFQPTSPSPPLLAQSQTLLAHQAQSQLLLEQNMLEAQRSAQLMQLQQQQAQLQQQLQQAQLQLQAQQAQQFMPIHTHHYPQSPPPAAPHLQASWSTSASGSRESGIGIVHSRIRRRRRRPFGSPTPYATPPPRTYSSPVYPTPVPRPPILRRQQYQPPPFPSYDHFRPRRAYSMPPSPVMSASVSMMASPSASMMSPISPFSSPIHSPLVSPSPSMMMPPPMPPPMPSPVPSMIGPPPMYAMNQCASPPMMPSPAPSIIINTVPPAMPPPSVVVAHTVLPPPMSPMMPPPMEPPMSPHMMGPPMSPQMMGPPMMMGPMMGPQMMGGPMMPYGQPSMFNTEKVFCKVEHHGDSCSHSEGYGDHHRGYKRGRHRRSYSASDSSEPHDASLYSVPSAPRLLGGSPAYQQPQQQLYQMQQPQRVSPTAGMAPQPAYITDISDNHRDLDAIEAAMKKMYQERYPSENERQSLFPERSLIIILAVIFIFVIVVVVIAVMGSSHPGFLRPATAPLPSLKASDASTSAAATAVTTAMANKTAKSLLLARH